MKLLQRDEFVESLKDFAYKNYNIEIVDLVEDNCSKNLFFDIDKTIELIEKRCKLITVDRIFDFGANINEINVVLTDKYIDFDGNGNPQSVGGVDYKYEFVNCGLIPMRGVEQK